jgi:hypothetical protein
MKKVLFLTLTLMAMTSFAGNHDPRAIANLLKASPVSLLQGIALAEKLSGPVTSAKFEIGDDGKLVISIYTIPEGLGVEPEKATLTELSGDPTISPLRMAAEVFTDKEHIARAAVHMTLFQLSPLSIEQVIERAVKKVSGTPIDIRNPLIRNKRPVADVVIHDSYDDEFYVVTVDLLSGKTEAKKI